MHVLATVSANLGSVHSFTSEHTPSPAVVLQKSRPWQSESWMQPTSFTLQGESGLQRLTQQPSFGVSPIVSEKLRNWTGGDRSGSPHLPKPQTKPSPWQSEASWQGPSPRWQGRLSEHLFSQQSSVGSQRPPDLVAQLSVPQMRDPAQSASLSQSPSPSAHSSRLFLLHRGGWVRCGHLQQWVPPLQWWGTSPCRPTLAMMAWWGEPGEGSSRKVRLARRQVPFPSGGGRGRRAYFHS